MGAQADHLLQQLIQLLPVLGLGLEDIDIYLCTTGPATAAGDSSPSDGSRDLARICYAAVALISTEYCKPQQPGTLLRVMTYQSNTRGGGQEGRETAAFTVQVRNGGAGKMRGLFTARSWVGFRKCQFDSAVFKPFFLTSGSLSTRNCIR